MAREIFTKGARFGPYRVERLMGAGAFGAVYEAVNTKLDKRVALKVLHLDVAQNPDAAARFFQEAKTVAKIRHPHIVDITDIDTCEDGSHQGVPFIAMEFLVGETLAARLGREGPMPARTAVDLLLPIIAAVHVAHGQRVVHRDIKPENIFLAEFTRGVVHPKLLDFGIAKVHTGSLVQTVENAAIGTPAFSSPEQMTDAASAGAGSDQWSMAVTLYHCLTGRLPFEGADGGLQAMIVRLCVAEPTPTRAFVPDVDPALEAVILRALRKLPSDRHPSMLAFGAALLPFASRATRGRFTVEFGEALSPGLEGDEGETTLDEPGSTAPAVTSQPAVAASLLGVSAHVQPSVERRPRLTTAAVMAIAVVVTGGAIGVTAAKMRRPAQVAAHAPAAAIAVTPVRAPTPEPTVAPAAPEPTVAASDDGGAVDPPTAAALPAVEPEPVAPVPQAGVARTRRHAHGSSDRRTDRAHRAPTTAPATQPAQPRTGIPIVE